MSLRNVKAVDMVGGGVTKIAYEGAEYVKVDGAARKGDIAEIIVPWGNQIAGAFYSVIQEDHMFFGRKNSEEFVFIDGETSQASALLRNVKLYRKAVEETPLSLGDRVSNLEKRVDKLEIEETRETYRKVTDRKPKVGDYVKFEDAHYTFLRNDKYYAIIDIDEFGDPQIIDEDGDEYDTGEDDFEVYEKVGAKTSDEQESLKVGDYVVPRISISIPYSITNSDMILGKIVGDHTDTGDDICIEVVKHERIRESGNSYSVNSKYFRKATEDEVAKAKAQIEESDKWTKIGRKPGEFKDGDIVGVTWSIGHKVGDIGVVVLADGTDRPLVRVGTLEQFDNVKLIAPVELRFDR